MVVLFDMFDIKDYVSYKLSLLVLENFLWI